MSIPEEYPRLPRGAGSISYNKGAWEGRWFEDGQRQYFRDPDYHLVYDELLSRWKRKSLGQYVPPAEMTVRDLVETYISRRIAYNKWKPSTIHMHQRTARLHIYPSIGKLRILSIDPPRLQHWIDQLATRYSPNTITACTSLLSAAFNHAVSLGIIPSNPCRYVEHPDVIAKTPQTWSLEHIALVDRALRDDPMWLALYRLVLSTGMRPGEVRALIWSDIDFVAGRVRIARTISEDAQGHIVVGTSTKSGTTRYVPLTAGPRAALLGWQAVQPRRSINPSIDWIFPGGRDKPLARTTWVNRHTRLIAETGVPAITFHGLRHTSGSLEMAAGTPLKVVSERLGHKDPAFTARVYQHVDTELQQAAADALDARLFGEKSG
jgi:integrase